ncbi:unnamed protein product [Diabrotica balteata]|uniref:RING-type domain-containing protein n=1 Tax=Diabrotica balteata TaxID=107213 RepID=A0A9N9SYY4_DIABA|nr:unnamed protein product [Diabrotica balteata]
MQGSTKIPITDLNAYITCKICDGYFVDACTIIECLHTFCRSCIIKYLQKNKYCPVCDVQVHKSKPLLNIRPDKTIQDIVYKLVPRLFQNEMQRRRDFYDSHPEAKPSSLEQCGEASYQHLLTPEETICLTLSYHGADNNPRYLRCPAAVTMGHLKKLIRAKYDLSENHRIDILYNQDCLSSSLTLMDVAYIYLWKRKGPIELTYRIYENTSKKLKLDVQEHQEQQETNLANNNNNNISNNNNWKEVQLRISENGEMSITGIQDAALSPSLLEIVNTEPKYKSDASVIESKPVGNQVPCKKELPGLKFIGKVNTTCTNIINSTTGALPIDNLTNIYTADSIPTYLNPIISTAVNSITLPSLNEHSIVSLPSPSSNCATLSSGGTTMVFSTINSTKCSTKTEDSLLKVAKPDIVETNAEKINTEVEKSLKRKIELNVEVEPPSKQSKPIILNHNMGLMNLSNNHPLKKHSKLNRNGEHVRDLPKTTEFESKTVNSTLLTTTGYNTSEIPAKKEPEVLKSSIVNRSSPRPGTPTTTKPLAMRAKTLISESGVKPPCYQPRSAYGPLFNVPRPVNTAVTTSTTSNISTKSDTQTLQSGATKIPSQKPDKSNPTPPPEPSQSSINHKIPNITSPQQSQSNKTAVPPVVSHQQQIQSTNTTTNKLPSINTSQQNQSDSNSTNKVLNINILQSYTIQGPQNKITISPSQPSSQPQIQHTPVQSVTSSSTKTTITPTSSSPQQSNQSTVNKISNPPIKSKPSTPIGYKTLRDPPKSWNSQISKANLTKSSPEAKYSDLKNVRPAKFFKMRNNMPRYLGNPASGVKPMYQVHGSPEKEKAPDAKSDKMEIRKHSIVKIDPKTLKPVSEKAPETTSLSNHTTVHQNMAPQNLNSHISSPMYPTQCLNNSPSVTNSGGMNLQNDLKINTSSVSIFNPLKLQSSPKNERRSPKSPHSPKLKTSTSSPTGNKRDKVNLNFTPPNPFVPNLSSKTISPNQFMYPGIPPGFTPYDPRVMAAYYNQWYGQRMPFPTGALPGLSLDLNQRKGLEILTSPGSPKMDTLAQTILNHQLPTRPSSLTSTTISPLPRPHNVPSLSIPTITKPVSTMKKSSKEMKSERSLETVVEKMTQNRNKLSNKVQNDSSNPRMREAETNKMEMQKNSPSIVDRTDKGSGGDSASVKRIEEHKAELNKINNINNKVDSETNQLLEVPSNDLSSSTSVSNRTEEKEDPPKAVSDTKSPAILTTHTTTRDSSQRGTEKLDNVGQKEEKENRVEVAVNDRNILNEDACGNQTEVKEKE